MKKPPTHGGARPGAGRPPFADRPTVQTAVRLTQAQHEKLRELGGAAWMRSCIDAGRPPQAARRPAVTATRNASALADERATLSETARQKVDRLVEAEIAALREKFWSEVGKKVEAREAKLTEKEGALKLRAKTLCAWMTEEEFKIVLGCLHPDMQPESMRPRFDKAFEIFNRLKGHLSLAPVVRKARGWK